MNLKLSNELSAGYDDYVSARSWIGPGLIFGRLQSIIRTGDKLLDIGIGTGLCSEPFSRAGLEIYGIDGAEGMLKICEDKKLSQNLALFDLTRSEEFPFAGLTFDLATAHAVFHLIGKLEYIFYSVNERLKSGGVFAFTYIDKNFSRETFFQTRYKGLFIRDENMSEMKVFAHSPGYIRKLCKACRFKLIQELNYTGFRDKEEQREVNFTLNIIRRP